MNSVLIHLIKMLKGIIFLYESIELFLIGVVDSAVQIITIGYMERVLSIKHGLLTLENKTFPSFLYGKLNKTIEKLERSK